MGRGCYYYSRIERGVLEKLFAVLAVCHCCMHLVAVGDIFPHHYEVKRNQDLGVAL